MKIKPLKILLFKEEKQGSYQKTETNDVIPAKGVVFKENKCENHENTDGNNFLNNL